MIICKMLKKGYLILRNVVVSAVALVVVLYLVLYAAVSVPAVQEQIKQYATAELSKIMGVDLQVGRLDIAPFNKVVLTDVKLPDRQGRQMVYAYKLGVGFNIWQLLASGRFDFNYVEVIGLDAHLIQDHEGEPLNLQFVIDAFKSKEQNKPPTRYDLTFRTAVIRKTTFKFDRMWRPRTPGRFNPDHIKITELRADLMLPVIKNDRYEAVIKHLAFAEHSGLIVSDLTANALLTPNEVELTDFSLSMPGTRLTLNTQKVALTGGVESIVPSLKSATYDVRMQDCYVTPSDFSAFLPALSRFDSRLPFALMAQGGVNDLSVKKFAIGGDASPISLVMSADIGSLSTPKDMTVSVSELKLAASRGIAADLISAFSLPARFADLAPLTLEAEGAYASGNASADAKITSSLGTVLLKGLMAKEGSGFALKADADVADLNLGRLTDNAKLGMLTAKASVDGRVAGNDFNGTAELTVSAADYDGVRYTDVAATVSRQGNDCSFSIGADNEYIALNAAGSALFDGRHLDGITLNADISHLRHRGNELSGRIDVDLTGRMPDSMEGTAGIADFSCRLADGRHLSVSHLDVAVSRTGEQSATTISSPMADGTIIGSYSFASLPRIVRSMAAQVMPSLISSASVPDNADDYLSFDLTLKEDNTLTEFFRLPVRIISPVKLSGSIDGRDHTLSTQLSTPYLQQGKDKLLKSTRLQVISRPDSLTGKQMLSFSAGTNMPAKNNNRVDVGIDLTASADTLLTSLGWHYNTKSSSQGRLALSGVLGRDHASGALKADIRLLPSSFTVTDTLWNVAPAAISYSGKRLEIHDLRVSHADQYLTINGAATDAPTDSIAISLNDINLNYVFDTLNINFVTFGGRATGRLFAKSLFSGSPVLYTPELRVKNMTYNGGLMGDALIASHWDNAEKKVCIEADVREGKISRTVLDGGIWVTRDSLSFNFDTSHVNVDFLKPFMQAFTTDISGRASGQAHLFGTFHDIDLVGKVRVDSVRMRIDYTNTYYTVVGDSVLLPPGRIEIPSMTIRDRDGHTAHMRGLVTHKYFRMPTFDFRMTDAKNLLCYDTNPTINPIWYGTVYANGSAYIQGVPGIVNIGVDVSTAPGTRFSFVLSDEEAAADYQFLTFTDKRKEAIIEQQKQTEEPSIEERFTKKVEMTRERPDIFNMDLRVSATPNAQMTLVMDPISGDKIRCTGQGNMQIGYNSETDAMTMYGRYTLDRGTYNFSLQDIILKDFTIRPGSFITFNGDPMMANLDIAAVYKVNTNLTDLDKSFSTDRELNRTNVPVEAVLKVTGVMTHPDINFDIELPTLTSDVERKVKSIISTDDMMNRQIIYLLALNRFYTPEYMGGSGNNNELASVASSTISSQLTNILGQLTDKMTLAPNFRTDAGDFSDLEFDVALSSSLLNNRLLLNGNFGYRDKATSNTTFIGDFDIEYLLNRQGTLRLKAYNHYNDQNYYLKSALTTQGVGVMLKYDFDRLPKFLRRRKKPTTKN